MFQYCHNFCQFSHDQIAKHMSEKPKICTTVLYIILIYNTITAVSLNKSQNTRDNLKQKDTQLKNLIQRKSTTWGIRRDPIRPGSIGFKSSVPVSRKNWFETTDFPGFKS